MIGIILVKKCVKLKICFLDNQFSLETKFRSLLHSKWDHCSKKFYGTKKKNEPLNQKNYIVYYINKHKRLVLKQFSINTKINSSAILWF